MNLWAQVTSFFEKKAAPKRWVNVQKANVIVTCVDGRE